jgi:hypothetical protein
MKNTIIPEKSFNIQYFIWKNKIIPASKASGLYKKGININLAGFCFQL